MTNTAVSTKPRKRSQRSLQTEQLLLATAKQIFSEFGFEKATTKEIAQAAQVAEGTLFHHFPNKMSLLKGIMIVYYETLQESADAIFNSHQDSPARFRALVLNHLQSTESEWAILRVLGQYGRYGDHDFAEAFYQCNKKYTRLFVQVLEELKTSLHIRSTVPTPLIRDTLFGSIEHFAIGHFGRGRAYDLDHFAEQLIDLIIFGSGQKVV
ncbi:MAG: TetR/AcrR family transcriptional regulator [Chloroflexota bacterium]